MDLYLRQHWSDKRLNHPELVDPLDLNDPNLVKAIWKPEVYFPNAKDAEFQYVTVPNVLVRIDPGGQILYMLRYVENVLFFRVRHAHTSLKSNRNFVVVILFLLAFKTQRAYEFFCFIS